MLTPNMTREQLLAIAKPILFSTPMVQAIQQEIERKTMTRRVIKNLPDCRFDCLDIDPEVCFDNDLEKTSTLKGLWATFEAYGDYAVDYPMRKSRYMVGDILYVRETWRETGIISEPYAYRADEEILQLCNAHGNVLLIKYRWRPSIHMPKEAARIFLRVTDVKVERVQDITETDVLKEGCRMGDQWAGPHSTPAITSRQSFMCLWDMVAKKGCEWAANPWVWAYTFEKVRVF